MKRDRLKRNIFLQNIPNVLSMSRIILTFVVMYMIFTHASVKSIVGVFVVAALTDFFDGRLARAFQWKSEFGRKIDMIADRFLWGGTALAFIIAYGIRGEIGIKEGIQLLFIMTREVISMPFAFIAFFSGKEIPHARPIAKVTTFVQGFALPSLIVSAFYPSWIVLSLPLSIVCGVTGCISALHYIHDIKQVKA